MWTCCYWNLGWKILVLFIIPIFVHQYTDTVYLKTAVPVSKNWRELRLIILALRHASLFCFIVYTVYLHYRQLSDLFILAKIVPVTSQQIKENPTFLIKMLICFSSISVETICEEWTQKTGCFQRHPTLKHVESSDSLTSVSFTRRRRPLVPLSPITVCLPLESTRPLCF